MVNNLRDIGSRFIAAPGKRLMKTQLAILALLMRLTRLFATTDLEYLDKEGADFYQELARKVDPKLHSQPEALKIYMERIRSLVLSDRVGFYFNISARVENERVILEGESERAEFKNVAREVMKHLGFQEVVDRVEVLPDLRKDPEPFGIAVAPHVLGFSRTATSGVPMDEALFGEPVYILKEFPDALLIKTFSGYWGLTPKAGIRRVAKTEFLRYVNGPKVLITEDYRTKDVWIPTGSLLVIEKWGVGRSCQVLGPKGKTLLVPKSVCRKSRRQQDVDRMMACAHSFLNAPYNLGGKNSSTGIDCSGLIQLSHRAIGVILPRDAKQQYLGGNLIPPYLTEALQPGDALYFINDVGQVDHTGFYWGNHQILHATGKQVKIQSLDPKATTISGGLARTSSGRSGSAGRCRALCGF